MGKSLQKQIASLPQKSGVYILKNRLGEILYVGKATNLRARVKSHFNQGGTILRSKITEIDHIGTKNEKDALILESQLIKKYQPRYNIEWRDDKGYFWVGITKESYPRVFLTHQPKSTTNRLANFFGPFVDGQELKSFLRQIRKIVPYRTCRTLPKKPCLYYDLKLCPGYCLGRKTIENYQLLKKLLKIYQGKSGRLEAYDISNIQGALATGSMVVFESNRPQKSQYRRFRIKTVKEINDIKMLSEIISRRLKHIEWSLPDLILIDGGRAQLNAASKVLMDKRLKIPLIALAKKEEKLYTPFSQKVVKLYKLPRGFSNALIRLRDEAHRFGISYHKKLREKALVRG